MSNESQYLINRRAVMMGIKPPPEEKKAPVKLAKKSAKRIQDDKAYQKIVKELMAKTDKCQVSSPVCVVKASGLHHLQKRSPNNLLDKKNLIRSCSPCNLYIEEHPDWSAEKGLTISRFKK